MQKLAKELEFISLIKSDGSGTIPVANSVLKTLLVNPLCDKDSYELHTLSLTEETYIAINFNAFVVKLKKEDK